MRATSFEALLEGWKHGLRNTWWVVDYNRQSLDAVVREGLWAKFESMFRNFGWEVVIVKYGRLMQAAFAEPGGEALRRWIDNCPNQMYAALCFQGGAAFRKHLQDDIGDQGQVSQLIDRRSDDELLALMSNLGGHDMASMIEAFEAIDHDRPGLLHRLHHQGRRPADAGPQGQPCGPDDGCADGEVARRAEHPPRP
jgi:pyruvate dehydrogenase E1 component